MMTMEIRQAKGLDLEEILRLYEQARAFMVQAGNPDQWTDGYPQKELLEADIREKRLYLVTQENEILGVLVLMNGPEADYATLKGNWLNDDPYQVIHRMASKRGGIAKVVFDWAMTHTDSLRIDTHEDNAPMRHVLEREGFVYVGELTLANGDRRRGYHRIKPSGSPENPGTGIEQTAPQTDS